MKPIKMLAIMLAILFVSKSANAQLDSKIKVVVKAKLHRENSTKCPDSKCSCGFSICDVQISIENQRVYVEGYNTIECSVVDGKLSLKLMDALSKEQLEEAKDFGLEIDDSNQNLFFSEIANRLGLKQIVLRKGTYKVDFKSNSNGELLLPIN